MPNRLRVVVILVAAFGFGLLAAWVKGQDGDGRSVVSLLRSDIGNLSAPWLVVAFLAGTCATRSAWGAGLGLVATLSALLGFYVLTSLVVDLGGYGLPETFARELWANRLYFVSGAVSGPLFGALADWRQPPFALRASVLAGALMVGEPIVMTIIGLQSRVTLVGSNAISSGVYIAEIAVGLVTLFVALDFWGLARATDSRQRPNRL